MRVLMDLDMPAHELGHMRRESGQYGDDGSPIMELVPLWEVMPVAKGRLMSILINSKAGGWMGFLTRGENFRNRLATILPYKGHREGLARDNVDNIKQMFADEYGAHWCDDYEADDAMAMVQWGDLQELYEEFSHDEQIVSEHANTIIATRDKDLDTVPGWHYKWWLRTTKADRDGDLIPPWQRDVEKGDTYWVTKREACRNFYKQMLQGDTSDNIHGLYRVGPKSAWLKQLDDMDDEEDMFTHVLDKYFKYYRNYSRPFMKENGQLLHMLRYKGDEWQMYDERDESYWDFTGEETLIERFMAFFRRLIR